MQPVGGRLVEGRLSFGARRRKLQLAGVDRSAHLDDRCLLVEVPSGVRPRRLRQAPSASLSTHAGPSRRLTWRRVESRHFA
jgi:hypothetical protein